MEVDFFRHVTKNLFPNFYWTCRIITQPRRTALFLHPLNKLRYTNPHCAVKANCKVFNADFI